MMCLFVKSHRLVADVETTPLVIPFVHSGMQDMMPIGSKLPATGKKVIHQIHPLLRERIRDSAMCS